jgi:hypothetical protein
LTIVMTSFIGFLPLVNKKGYSVKLRTE